MFPLWRPSTCALWQCSKPLSTTAKQASKDPAFIEALEVFARAPPRTTAPADTHTAVAARKLSAVEQAALQDLKNRQIYDLPPERDPILHFLTNKIMKHGQYSRAQKHVSQMLLHIHTMTRSPPVPIVHEAILKASPAVRVASSKRGGRVVMRPLPLSERQRTSQGIAWVIKASDDRPGQQLGLRLAKEMVALVRGESAALKNKQQAHTAGMLARGALKV